MSILLEIVSHEDMMKILKRSLYFNQSIIAHKKFELETDQDFMNSCLDLFQSVTHCGFLEQYSKVNMEIEWQKIFMI